jgi:NAD(P)-dependent dehydrogenase (short-subunit alcohol dehydrogenase family)
MLVLKHSLRLLAKDRRAVFAALSARVGSIGDNKLGGWHGYRAAKAALNQFIHGASVELKRTHKKAIAVCLHPGTVATPFTEKYAAHHKTTNPAQAAGQLIDVIEGLEPSQTGGFYDFAGLEIPW